ncbi:GntR family transcriptional regulator [Oscillibacter sp.]|uniref:GntR family transcriptional regulator n=1 Tax=Oscillibacter sp. TaxID=1945593 RepID=UPI00339555C6
MLNKEALTPNYMKIQQYVYDKIKCGEYEVGTKIPSEIELAELFSVSRITANKAIKEMSLTGILERVRGKGTFVASRQTVSTASKAFGSAVKLGVTTVRNHQLVQFRILDRIYPELVETVHASPDEKFYEIILANKNGSTNESLDFTYIPCKLMPDITPTLEYLRSHYVFDYLNAEQSVPPKFMKIFVNTTHYDFLDTAQQLLENGADMTVWCTGVYDISMNLLGVTYTTYPSTSQDIPLFTFSL